MNYPVPSYTSFTIPTGATSGSRITFNEFGDGTIRVYDSNGDLVDLIGGNNGQIISFSVGSHTSDVGIIQGTIYFGLASATPSFNNAATLSSGRIDGGELQFNTNIGSLGSFTDGTTLLGIAGTTSAVTGSTSSPHWSIADDNGNTAADLLVSGTVIHTDFSGNRSTWQTPSYVNGWTGGPVGGTVQPLRYRYDAEDNLVLVGAAHGGTSGGMFTLPAAYRPAITQRGVAVFNNGGTPSVAFCEINSSGAVSMNAGNAGDVYICLTVPLGHIS